MSAASIEIDQSRFPMVYVTFRGIATDAEFQAYLDGMTRMLARRETNVVIMDATQAGRTPPKHRKMQSDWMKAHQDELARHSLGTAFVITSALVRGALTAILWVAPMASPHTVVGTLAEAEQWARDQLKRATANAG
jgi:hypothetical protein